MPIQSHIKCSESYLPPKTFVIYREGKAINLTSLLDGGAKHTVVYAAFAKALGIPSKIPSRRPNDPLRVFAKHNDFLYRALDRFVSQGLLERFDNVIDPLSVEPVQRKGVFWRASEAARQKKRPNLINELQNSKSEAKLVSPLSEGSAKHIAIPDRCGWLRSCAIRQLATINKAEWFVRNPQTKQLNPALSVRLDRIERIFGEWDEETLNKVILMHNLKTGEYVQKPYKTRFNDEGRKLKNIKIYNTGIENSLAKYKTGIFLTLTTDPQIWMRPKGEKFTRHIKDGGKKYKFEGEGQGGSLYEANRHESTAWRKWYEKFSHQLKKRPDYIRCVEFQENGLIHTHVLIFGVAWNKKWYDFAKEWGTVYKQGFMNKAYEVRNDGEKWVWKDYKPADSKNRSPADYLKKYLIKSMYDTNGFYMYWVCNKRFFTMSENLRYFSLDEKIAEEDWKKAHTPEKIFEFVGACNNNAPDISHTIKQYLKREEIIVNVVDNGEPHSRFPANYERGFWKPRKPAPEKPDIENPDQYDNPEETAYFAQLEAERKEREARRERLRQRKANQETPSKTGYKNSYYEQENRSV